MAGPDDRALLFRYMLPRPWARAGWMLPGGAIDPGETAAQTAARRTGRPPGAPASRGHTTRPGPTCMGLATATRAASRVDSC